MKRLQTSLNTQFSSTLTLKFVNHLSGCFHWRETTVSSNVATENQSCATYSYQ